MRFISLMIQDPSLERQYDVPVSSFMTAEPDFQHLLVKLVLLYIILASKNTKRQMVCESV